MTSHAALFRNGHRGRAIDWTAGIRGVRAWLSVDLHAGPHTRGDRTVLPRRNLTRSARRVEATRRTVAIPTVATPSTRHTRRTTGRSPCQGRRNRAPSHARALRQVGYEILWCPTRVRKSVNHKSLSPLSCCLGRPLPTHKPAPWRPRALAVDRDRPNAAAHPVTTRVFRGLQARPPTWMPATYGCGDVTCSAPGLTPGHPARADKHAPAAILAETLGYSATIIERRAVASAATYAKYIASQSL